MIDNYSNVDRVFNRFRRYYPKESEIKLSTRQGKKYMVLDPNTDKWVHFGAMGYEDYTKHQDKTRRDKYHRRMGRFKDAYKYSPGYLSLKLLW